MNICAEKFIENLKSKDLNFEVKERGEKTVVSFPYDGRKTHFFFSGDDGEYAQMQTLIESVSEDKYVDVVLACNQVNSTYRFLKFVVDEDNDVMAMADAILDPGSADEECFELLIRSLQIIKDAKPTIMKAIYA